LGGVLASLDVLWVNHPNRVADAVYKPVQLVIAARCGLLVPDTLITNQAAAVRRFATDAPHQTVTKALGAVAIGEEGRRKVAFTRRLSQDDLDDLAGIDVTAHKFQRWVPKAYDARVIVIGRPRVFSVDIDSELVDLAYERLARTGFHPTLAAVDGVDGLPQHAPYDRIIATCSVPTVPWSWAEQLTEGGLVLVDVKVGVHAGNPDLVLLQRCADRLEGRFLSKWAGFMAMRHQKTEAESSTDSERSAPTLTRTTAVSALPWDNLVAWFIATLEVSSPMSFSYLLNEDNGQPQVVRFTVPEGSWAEVAIDADDDGTREVRKGGPRAL
jgi:hypothetical protein